MAVTLLSAVDPYPTDAGKKVVLAGFVTYFAERYGPDQVHYLLVGEREAATFPVELHSVPLPSRRAALANVMTKVSTGRASLQEALLRSRVTARGIARAREHIQPTIEVYDTVRMAQFADDQAGRQVCYLDDLFSQRYAAMLEAARTYPDVDIRPLGNFASHVPPTLRPLADNRRAQVSLLKAERALVAKSEDKVARTFRRSLLVNSIEASTLVDRTGVSPDRIRAVPPLVEAPAPLVRRVNRPVFIFLGLLSLPHNDDGLRWFLTRVWPLVLERLPGAELRVIGRGARPELTTIAERFTHSVSIEGYVPELSSALSDAAALVNPLRFGSGVKLKVVEALARGLPVVSTTVGAEGIRSGRDAGVLVDDEAEAFAERMCDLTSPQANLEVAEAATAHFRDVYSRDAVFAAYDAAFGT